MLSLLLSLCALILGYLFYGKLAEKIFGPDPAKPTPAVEKADGETEGKADAKPSARPAVSSVSPFSSAGAQAQAVLHEEKKENN